MTDWTRFDFRGVSLYTGYADRERPLVREFARVGLENVIPFWSSPDPYLNVIERHTRLAPTNKGAWLACTLKHQQMVRMAYDSGSKTGLFFEDDIRFLKDEDLLGQIVRELPDDADVALFDWFQPHSASDAKYERIVSEGRKAHWVRFSEDLRSCGFYALSRRGMERYLSCLEKPARRTCALRVCDTYWGDLGDLNCYCAYPCAGVQCVPGGRSGFDYMWGKYEKSGIRRDNYA